MSSKDVEKGQLLPTYQQHIEVPVEDSKKPKEEMTFWTLTTQECDCQYCDRLSQYYKLHPQAECWAFILITLGMIGAAYSAYCLAVLVLPPVFGGIYTLLKQGFCCFSSSVQGSPISVDKVIEGGIAQQFVLVGQYAHATQTEFLDQQLQAAQWIKETHSLIMEALTTNLVQASFLIQKLSL